MANCKDCWGFSRCNALGLTVDFHVDDGVCVNFDECKNMTNADRIRAMTDEELAKFIMYEFCSDSYGVLIHNKTLFFTTNDVMEWLKQPAKEGE